ncbi:MAG: tRNA epoxyqueuosine(34) reductase QueG [Magnetococcales bacterium]|nr:tRNA epoxyqueuosine(34) reductase QueG [Magnetococcales bacterium]
MSYGNNPWLKLKEDLRTQAHAVGFEAVGFSSPHPPNNGDHFLQWLDQGWHGSMTWMEKNRQRRMDPGQLVPGSGVIMSVGINYRPPDIGVGGETRPGFPDLAACCRITDYHEIIKEKLFRLASWVEQACDQPVPGRFFVDTAPVMEKSLAVSSGLGWQGKNTLLVTRRWGCWLLLGEYFLPFPLPPDPPADHHCGTCRRCCDVCPTGALDGRGGLDARRCIAYLTLESKHPIPREYRASMGNRVAGCDACLMVCPWNRFAAPTQGNRFIPRESLSRRPLADWAAMTKAEFDVIFAGTSVKRMGRIRFLRNIAIALGNSGEATAVTALIRLLQEPAALIRGAAAWGLGQTLQDPRCQDAHLLAVCALDRARRIEQDPVVAKELIDIQS